MQRHSLISLAGRVGSQSQLIAEGYEVGAMFSVLRSKRRCSAGEGNLRGASVRAELKSFCPAECNSTPLFIWQGNAIVLKISGFVLIFQNRCAIIVNVYTKFDFKSILTRF